MVCYVLSYSSKYVIVNVYYSLCCMSMYDNVCHGWEMMSTFRLALENKSNKGNKKYLVAGNKLSELAQ